MAWRTPEEGHWSNLFKRIILKSDKLFLSWFFKFFLTVSMAIINLHGTLIFEGFYPFLHTTVLQQTTLKTSWQKHRKKSIKCWYYYWKELKTLWQKKKKLVFNTFFFCQCFQKLSATEASESVFIREKGLRECIKRMLHNIMKFCHYWSGWCRRNVKALTHNRQCAII